MGCGKSGTVDVGPLESCVPRARQQAAFPLWYLTCPVVGHGAIRLVPVVRWSRNVLFGRRLRDARVSATNVGAVEESRS